MTEIECAVRQLRAAVEEMAGSTEGVQERLQRAWAEHVQLLWEKRCLPEVLHERFSDLWERYTARTDDPRSTELRELDDIELAAAVSELVALAFDTQVVATG